MIICDRLVAPFISSKDRSFAVALQTLGPLVAERLAKEDELGPDWPGKPVRFPSETNDQITSGSCDSAERSHFLAAGRRGRRGAHRSRPRATRSLDELRCHPHIFNGVFIPSKVDNSVDFMYFLLQPRLSLRRYSI
jgi:hypothetical protein